MPYTDAELVEDIQSVADEVGGTPTLNDYREHGTAAEMTIYNYFGSWQDALETAGYEPRAPDSEVPDAELIEDIRSVANEVGGTPTLNDFREHGTAGVTTIYNHFGSWQDALETAGYEPRAPDSEVTDEELLAELDRLADELGQRPTIPEMNEHGAHWGSTYRRAFGSWNAACEAVGLDAAPPADPTTDALLEELARVAEACGTPPTKTDMNAKGAHSPQTYVRRFGSWNEAVEAAGFEPNPTTAVADDSNTDDE